MRIALLLPLALVAACRGAAPAAPPPTPTDVAVPAQSTSLIDGDLHGLDPSDDLVRWASRFGDVADRARATEELKSLPPAQRVAILRTGIRLRDPMAARTCADLLVWQELDDWEQGRMTRLLADAIVDPGYRVATGYDGNFGSIFESASGEDLAYVLDLVAAHGGTIENAGNLSILHKSASAGHLPQLARVALSTDADVRRHALDIILTVTLHTDRHRDDVAAAILGIGAEEAHRRFPDTGQGLPPLLAAVLSLKEFPFDPDSKLRDWAWRWLADSRPAPRDVEFLLKLDEERPNDVIPWVLRDVADARIDPWLRATSQPREPEHVEGEMRRPPPGPDAIRLGVLALRGDRDALVRLVEIADEHSESLAVLLAVAPRAGREYVEKRILGADAALAFETLDRLRRAWEDVPNWSPVTWDESVFDGFDRAALAAVLDGARFAKIGVCVPGCRTREIAETAAAVLLREPVPSAEDESPIALSDEVAAFLETAAPDGFRVLLRDWADSAKGTTREEAISALARMGDPQSGALLVEAARAGDIELDVLARSPCQEVLAFLREKAKDDFSAAVAYGVATGMPERVGLLDFCTYGDDPLPAADLDAIRALLLDGRWKDAVARALVAQPDGAMESVGLDDDDRVRAHLRRLQERRELRLYPWATAELANMGDPDARTEYEHALRTGRYRWADESEQIAFDDGLRALAFWIELMEVNCCRFSSIRCYVFDHWFDFEFDTEGGRGLGTPVAEARRFVARAGGRFVRSRVRGWRYGSYVPAPR